MKQFKRFGLIAVTLLLTVTMAFAAKPNIHILPQEERLQVQEVLPPEPVTQPDRWPSVRCLTPYQKSKRSLTLQVSRS